uniref:Pkinase-domain-containing protein n=1 Tax=Mycena chlorophos TaxID=658473 RepID=A0ABQ0M586_MYCCL|nr:predicted protein [Mycena chlorophos]
MEEDVSMQSQSQSGEGDITQSTQPISQETQEFLDTSGCWGLLVPVTSGDERVRLLKTKKEYSIGRDRVSDIHLANSRISGTHATITWNEQDGKESVVLITDTSTNGTWVGKDQLTKGEPQLLRDGVHIRLGPNRSKGRKSERDPAPTVYVFCDLVSLTYPVHHKYDVRNHIGSGTFGTVERALRRSDATNVAIKFIDSSKRIAGAGKHRGGLYEVKNLQRAQHSNIVRLLEFYENQDLSLHLVFELVENRDLEKYIQGYKDRTGLSEEMTLHFTHQICAAGAYLHSLGIVHCDLKPENILLTANDPPIVKVADFGVAKLISDSSLQTICGTIHYMAPEVVTHQRGGDPYDDKVDCWAVGAIVFCMLTTYPPFPISGNNPNELRALLETSRTKSIRWNLVDARMAKNQVSREAKDFLEELLVYEPGGRMALADAHSKEWFNGFKPAYSYTINGESSLGRTLSWFESSMGSTGSSELAVAGTMGVLREHTVDPEPEEPDDNAAPMESSPPAAAARRPSRSRRDSAASRGRGRSSAPARGGASGIPGLPLTGIPEASIEPYEAPAASSSKAKGKGKAKQSPVPVASAADVPDPMSNSSSMYLYGSPAAANPQLSVVVEEPEEKAPTPAPGPSRAPKRKRDHTDDLVAQAFGGESLSTMSTLSSDGFMPQTPLPPPVQAPRRTTRASSAAPSGPPPAKRGRTAEPVAGPSKPPSRAPRKPPSTSKPAGRAPAAASGRGRRVSAEPEASGSKPARATRQKRLSKFCCLLTSPHARHLIGHSVSYWNRLESLSVLLSAVLMQSSCFVIVVTCTGLGLTTMFETVSSWFEAIFSPLPYEFQKFQQFTDAAIEDEKLEYMQQAEKWEEEAKKPDLTELERWTADNRIRYYYQQYSSLCAYQGMDSGVQRSFITGKVTSNPCPDAAAPHSAPGLVEKQVLACSFAVTIGLFQFVPLLRDPTHIPQRATLPYAITADWYIDPQTQQALDAFLHVIHGVHEDSFIALFEQHIEKLNAWMRWTFGLFLGRIVASAVGILVYLTTKAQLTHNALSLVQNAVLIVVFVYDYVSVQRQWHTFWLAKPLQSDWKETVLQVAQYLRAIIGRSLKLDFVSSYFLVYIVAMVVFWVYVH